MPPDLGPVEVLDAVGRAVVAGTLGWAAVGKLADLPGLRATLYLSRVTRPWVRPLTWGLPLAELALGFGLLVRPAAWPAAVAAIGLLGVFLVFLAVDPSARRGCACFGGRRASSRRAGIVRDIVLIVVLLPAVVVGPGAATVGLDGDRAVGAAGGASLLVAGLLTWAVRRERSGRVATPVPARRTPARHAPDFDLPGLDGGRLGLAERLVGTPGLTLVFVEPGCAQCAALAPHLGFLPDVVVLVAVPAVPGDDLGQATEVRVWASDHGVPPEVIGVDVEGAVADAYRVRGVPSACRVGTDGLLRDGDGALTERLVVGAEQIMAAFLR